MKFSFDSHIFFLLQPLFIVLYPSFFLYSRSLGEVFFSEFLYLLCLLFIATFFFYFVLNFFLKSGLKSSVLLTVFYLGAFLLPLIYNELENLTCYGIRCFRFRYFLIIYCVFLIFIFLKVLKLKKMKNIWGKFLIIPFFFLIVFSGFNSLFNLFQIKKIISIYKKNNNIFLEKKSEVLSFSSRLGYLPDIYFVILDCYPSEKSLQKYFGYDNSSFVSKLKSLGFYIAYNSMSNYPVTVRSIPSTLSMNYCSLLRPNDQSHGLAYYMMNNNNVMNYLKQLDYEFYNIDSSWGPAKYLKNSYYKPNYFIPSEFIAHYFGKTIFGLMGRYLFEKNKYNLILNQLNYLLKLNKKRKPKFVFIHVHSPHSPFIFNADGSFVSLSWPSDTEAYLKQLSYISNKVYNNIKFLLNHIKKKPIIILQSDHGSPNYIELSVKMKLDEEDSLPSTFGILSSFYLPVMDEKELPKDISPINNFRFIFNKYFGTNFKILKNKSNY